MVRASRHSTHHWPRPLYPELQCAEGHVAAQQGPSTLTRAGSSFPSLSSARPAACSGGSPSHPGCRKCRGPSCPSNPLANPVARPPWPPLLLHWPPRLVLRCCSLKNVLARAGCRTSLRRPSSSILPTPTPAPTTESYDTRSFSHAASTRRAESLIVHLHSCLGPVSNSSSRR